MFAARLQAYLPGGAALGEMVRPIHWEASVAHNDIGALTVDYSTLSAGGEYIERPLADGLEVAVEVWNGSAWVEPRGCRFVRIKQNEQDKADGSKVFRVTFVSYGWLLKKAALLGGAFTSGRRTFVTPTAGGLLNAILTENASRSGIPMALVGGGANDAGGSPWPTQQDIPYTFGVDYFSIVRGLQEAGMLDWATQARGLYAYLPDSTSLSPDLSSTIRLDLGVDITEAPAEETIEGLVGKLGVSADAGGTTIVDEVSAPDPHGTWEGHLAVGQASDETAAIAMGEAELERVARARQQFTHGLILRDDAKIPLIHYWPGCWITAPTNSLAESVRVQQITLTYGDDGFGANVVLNDRFTETDIRRARTLNALAGGQVGSGGAPPPVAVDPEADRVPSTPTGLDAVAGLVFQDGFPRGVVTFTWNPVSTGTDGGAMVISLYELQYRIDSGDWQSFVGSETTTDLGNLDPGSTVDGRVRAQGARTLNASAWSAIDSVTVSGDVTPPTAPSAPTISARLGIVTVTWDGLNNVGGSMSNDFHHVEVALADSPTPTTVVGILTTAGSLPVEGQTLGELRTARLRAVDTSGNASAWSDPSDPILVQGVTGPDMEFNSVDANILQAGSVTGDKLSALLALISRIVAPAETGQRVEISQQGIQLYTADENRWVNLPTDPEEDPEFRGRIEAEGLTVRQGAQFFSTLNEFAKDSVISLAEQVAAPITSPNVTNFWEWFAASTSTPATGSLGTFSLDPSQVVHAFYNAGWPCYHLLQPISGGGARLWYYNLNGTIVTSGGVPVVFDMPTAWEVTSVARGTDGDFRIMYKSADKWWIWDYSLGSTAALAQKEYIPGNTLRDPILTMDGNNIWVAESFASGPTFYRVTTNTNPVTKAETIVSSGAPSGSSSPCVFHRGTLDLGVTKFVVSYPGTSSFRVYSSTGAYESGNSWETPYAGTKAAGFWDPTTSRWRTFAPDSRLYRHSPMIWNDSALDTWHLAQTFYDAQATGGLHETKVGTVRTITPKKRSWVRIQPVPVPYAGGTDDPNQWRIYGKTGAAPGIDGAGLILQESGAYTVLTRDRSTLLLTSGTAPPTSSNFPGATPARLLSQRTFPSDSTRRILDLRGDGSGWWGGITVDGAGDAFIVDDTLPEVSLYQSTVQTLPTTMGALSPAMSTTVELPRPARVMVIVSAVFGAGGGSTTNTGILAPRFSGAFVETPVVTIGQRGLRFAGAPTLGASFMRVWDLPAGSTTIELWGGATNPVDVRNVHMQVETLRWMP